MMTIPMDNSVDNPTREHVQRLLNQNAELENRRRKAAQARIPSDPNAWQKMRENYQAIILEDHDFSEQNEIEFALWQLHYRRIEELRATYNAAVASAGSNSTQNGKGPVRGASDRVTKIRSQFKTFLTEATGFYHDLMLKIRAKYGLPLGYLSGDSTGQIPMLHDGNKSAEMKKGLISCHRCFIYLGDLGRYKGLYGDVDSKALEYATSSSYYMQAISLWPSRGNPHHQLAILATYSGDELLAIYRYFRSLAAESPFVTARDNLIIAFEKNRQSYSQLFGGTKPASTMGGSSRAMGRGRGKGDARLQTKDTRPEGSSGKDRPCSISMILKSFNVRFVRLNGILFTKTSLETFGEVFTAVRSDFVELLSSGRDEEYNFGTEASDCRLAIVRLIAVLIFSIHNVNRETENQSYAEILQRSVLLENAFSATFELVGLMIDRCSTLNDVSTSYLVPGIMVYVEWLACHQDVAVCGSGVEEKQASARLFFWNQCVNFLNKIISRGYTSIDEDEDDTCFSSMTPYEEGDTANRFALPEDFELRGFLPLLPAQVILDFSGMHSHASDGNKERNARMKRILAAGKALANVVRLGDERLYFNSKLKKFSIGQEHLISDENEHTTLRTPKLACLEEENPILGQINMDILQQPKPPLQVEVEEEDEVIVFKPFMAEKKDDSMCAKQLSSEILVDEINGPKVSMVNAADSFSDGLEVFPQPNAFNTSSRTTFSAVNTTPQYVQFLQPTTSVWPSQQQAGENGKGHLPYLSNGAGENGMGHLPYLSNGPTVKPVSQNYAGTFQSSFSDPLHLPVNNGGNYSLPMPHKLVPSKFDSIMYQGADNLPRLPSPFIASGLKKNPVSRPVRHMGPPPGFGSLPSKTVDESLSALSLKAENTGISQMDDYRWLDGYNLHTVNRNVGLDGSISTAGHAYHNFGNGTGPIGTVDFPFPGKQVMSLQPTMENLNGGWTERHLSEQLQVYQEQQQQRLSVNQQPAVQKHQYQGQSLWEGFL